MSKVLLQNYLFISNWGTARRSQQIPAKRAERAPLGRPAARTPTPPLKRNRMVIIKHKGGRENWENALTRIRRNFAVE